MKLFYRGHSYIAHNNTVPTTDVAVEGKYRGANVTWHNKQTPVKHSDRLTYRGVHNSVKSSDR